MPKRESEYRRRRNARPDPWTPTFEQRHADIEAAERRRAEEQQQPAGGETPATNDDGRDDAAEKGTARE